MPSKKQTEVLLKTAVCAVVAGIVTIAVSAPLAPIVAGTVGIGTFFYLTKDYGYVNQARDFVTSAVRSVRR